MGMMSSLTSRIWHVSYKQELLVLRQYLHASLVLCSSFYVVLQFTWVIYMRQTLLWFYSVSNLLIISDFHEHYLIALQMYVYFDVWIYCTRHIYRTAIIMYAQSPQFGKPSNWKFLSRMKVTDLNRITK